MRAPTALLVTVLALGGHAWAQDTQTVSLSQRSYDIFDLNPATTMHVHTFPVRTATRLVVDVTAASAPVDVSITNPLGASLNSATFDRFTIAPEDAPPLGMLLLEAGNHVQAIVDAPLSGTWTVTVSLSGAMTTLGSIVTVATGGLGVAATMSRPYYQVGESAAVALIAFEGTTPLTGATVTANLYQTGSEGSPTLITLRDDGSDPDATTGDGVYSTGIDGLTPGHYLVDIELETGSEHAIASTDFEVIATLARFDGTKSDSGVDTDADGLFDFISLDFGVTIDTPGTYDAFAVLRVPGGTASIQGGARDTLAAGAQTIAVPFAASDLRKYMTADAPWQIREARLLKVGDPGEPDRLADRVDDFGLTNAYTLGNLQRPTTLIVPGIVENGIDTNANGLFDQLSVSFQIDTRTAGSYTWTGDLRAPDGTVLGITSGQGFLDTGLTPVGFTFDGRSIGASDLNGPYTVGDIAVYGPPDAAAVLAELGHTRAYSADNFEGAPVRISGKTLLIKDDAHATTHRTIVFVSNDLKIGAMLGMGIDLLADGASLQVYNTSGTSESVCINLPTISGAWKTTGKGKSFGYKYKDAHFSNGPCNAAIVKHGLLKVSCVAKTKPINYSLDEATQGSVGIAFTTGNTTYCTVFGGKVTKDSGTTAPKARGKGQFQAKTAAIPDTCRIPQGICTPNALAARAARRHDDLPDCATSPHGCKLPPRGTTHTTN
jgi:hypothetical protein